MSGEPDKCPKCGEYFMVDEGDGWWKCMVCSHRWNPEKRLRRQLARRDKRIEELERQVKAQAAGIQRRAGTIQALTTSRDDLRRQLADMRAIVDHLQILDIAACEAFGEGVATGQPTSEQIDAMMNACGGIRRLLWPDRTSRPHGKGYQTARWLRDLAARCEAEAAKGKP